LAASGGDVGFRLVDASMRRQVREDFARQSRFREALQQGGLVPFFQPIVDLINGRPLGFEALVRWRDEDGHDQAPAEFLPVARQIGLTGELDLVVITQVLAALPALVAATDPAVVGPLLMSVNLSAQLLDSAELRQRLLDLIEAHPLPPPWHLQVELLEEALQESNQGLDAFLARLAVLKVGIAIDDFGTGYSSLARLDSLPIQAFKIDRSFVERLNDAVAPSNQLLRTINTLATDMGLAVTAEGVETAMQRDWLRHSGFLSGQGNVFARPLSLEQAEAYLRAQGSSDVPLPPG
jgi:EAL domain-containing protein (putative c-di-GMP-specific phosphodiesterase class I)